MLSKQAVVDAIKAGRKSQSMDGRDYRRLSKFYHIDEWEPLGVSLKDDVDKKPYKNPTEWTESNILEQLKADVELGFDKALNQRGLSAPAMFIVVRMWMWVLEDDLQYWSDDDYAQYGLPFFKAVAVKYGFGNPIGEDTGSEQEYAAYLLTQSE